MAKSRTNTNRNYKQNKITTNTGKLSKGGKVNKNSKVKSNVVKLPKQTKLQKLKSIQHSARLHGNITKEDYTKFAKRINTRLRAIEKQYGTDSNLYKMYVNKISTLSSNLQFMRDDGTIALKTGKQAYNELMNSEKNALGLNLAQQELNRINSYDTVAIRNEKTRETLKELGKNTIESINGKYYDAMGIEVSQQIANEYFKKESEKLEKIGEYISLHYEEVLYKDSEDKRSAEDTAIINILRQKTNTYQELMKVYDYITKKEEELKHSKTHQKRLKTLKRLESKKVKK